MTSSKALGGSLAVLRRSIIVHDEWSDNKKWAPKYENREKTVGNDIRVCLRQLQKGRVMRIEKTIRYCTNGSRGKAKFIDHYTTYTLIHNKVQDFYIMSFRHYIRDFPPVKLYHTMEMASNAKQKLNLMGVFKTFFGRNL